MAVHIPFLQDMFARGLLQYAIVFKTPAYYNANIDKAVNVMIMLQRRSDLEVSEAKAFTYYPQNKG